MGCRHLKRRLNCWVKCSLLKKNQTKSNYFKLDKVFFFHFKVLLNFIKDEDNKKYTGQVLWCKNLRYYLGHPYPISGFKPGSSSGYSMLPMQFPAYVPGRQQMLAQVLGPCHLCERSRVLGCWLSLAETWLSQAFGQWSSRRKSSSLFLLFKQISPFLKL